MSEVIPMNAPNVPQCKRVLYRGLKGNDVEWMQETLMELNDFYKFCPSSKVAKADGHYGDETAKLVKFFQYKENLIPDTFFDRATCEKMNYRWSDYLDIQSRTGWGRYRTINEYLASRFED
jgi:peptidoglycan hydrolase-like protein with peptidoglycan-binding domain